MRRVLFYGDSNTYGFDPRTGHTGGRYPENERWVGIIREKLAPDTEILDDSLPGRCIPAMKFEMEALDSCLTAAGELDLFAVMLGTNDYLSMPHPDPDKVAAKLSDMLAYVRARTDAEFLVIAPPVLDFSEDRYYRSYSTTDGRLSAALIGAAKEAGADALDAASWNLSIDPGDHIHLTKDGHRVFAANMLGYFLRDAGKV